MDSFALKVAMLASFYQTTIATPFGEMAAVCSATHLLALMFKDMKNVHKKIRQIGKCLGFDPSQLEETKTELTMDLQSQIDGFFKGSARKFCVPVLLTGSLFQQRTYRCLVEAARFGERISYSALARKVSGNEASRRAVALALGCNPILLVIPCHRVLPSNIVKGIGGFAAGVQRKQELLRLEERIA
ncbi:O-6-methylguanine-DNA-alkyltransferase [Mitosporidium daphniae]|uniref:Methylated-DNA--protein-cysteine methyltransferase n=1 Tax=Mitosporidium daphniae TaxID=1485682 RepID=A0A098VRE2_9MICR|nr:O-6-methylguanine-DNA-alkyltransferase [Mitosporidium daphniae]KGG51602.1 O-6-methylguanine-DNA-alkyltransferase [Mitosporidium daphniae]|eukprot:XP_013238029.1 O-6-methylguanine-DNA-alkyltransferase [Mitosporidium daphniae]